MKKSTVFFAAILSLFFLSSIHSITFSPFSLFNTAITGSIKHYGPAESSELGFQTESNMVYRLDVSKDSNLTLSQLQELQGQRLRLTGRADKKNKGLHLFKNGTFVVFSVEVLPSKNLIPAE